MRVSRLWTSEGTRRFASEVGIVVLGVVIALWLGQIEETADWAKRRSEAHAALKVELTRAAGSAVERQWLSGCIDRRLAEVAKVLDVGASTGRLPAVRNFPQPPMRPWRSTAWDTVVASQAASRFPVETLNELASAYQTVEQLRFWNIEEKEAWTSLSLLEGGRRPLTPQLEIHLRDAHARAKYYARIIPLTSRQLTKDIQQAGIDIRRSPRRPTRTNPVGFPNSVCQPMLILPR